MSQENQKNEKEMRKLQNLKPFKPGHPGGPGRPKGKRDFETDFKLACREVAKALRLGKEPDAVLIELIKTGIKAGLKEKFPFWKELLERKYGKVPDKIEADVTVKKIEEIEQAMQKVLLKRGQKTESEGG